MVRSQSHLQGTSEHGRSLSSFAAPREPRLVGRRSAGTEGFTEETHDPKQPLPRTFLLPPVMESPAGAEHARSGLKSLRQFHLGLPHSHAVVEPDASGSPCVDIENAKNNGRRLVD